MKEIKSKGEMISDAKAMMFAVTVAIIAGGVSWILYKKPSWRAYILPLTRQALSVAENIHNSQ